MRKFMTAATLALTVSVAGAQAGGGYTDNTQYVAPATTTATAAPVAGSVVLTDIPAGHWAREAVQTVVEAGLIQGFPDGTFRGNQNLTRYEAAMIFSRLLQSGALSGSDISDEDLLVITRGMQEVSTELAAITSRLTAVEQLTTEQQAQIDALKTAINGIGTNTGTDTTALEARIAALEARIATLEAAPVVTTPVDTTAPVVNTPVDTTAPIVIETPDVVVTPSVSNMYAGIGAGYYPKNSNYGASTKAIFDKENNANTTYPGDGYFDCDPVFGAKNNTPNDPESYCGSILGTVGVDNVYGPIGGRVNVEYVPGRNAVAADVNAVANFDLGLVQPYVGAGVGIVNGSKNYLDSSARGTDIYGNLLGGVDFKVTPNVGIFAEGNGKYYFSNNTSVAQTVATGNVADPSQKGLGFGARAGVKLFF